MYLYMYHSSTSYRYCTQHKCFSYINVIKSFSLAAADPSAFYSAVRRSQDVSHGHVSIRPNEGKAARLLPAGHVWSSVTAVVL